MRDFCPDFVETFFKSFQRISDLVGPISDLASEIRVIRSQQIRSQQIAGSEVFDRKRLCSYALSIALQKSSFVGFPNFDCNYVPDLNFFRNSLSEKRDVHKISARNSGAGNGCASLWAPGIFGFFLLENPHAHKIPPFRVGSWVFLEGGGGGSANFIFTGMGIF